MCQLYSCSSGPVSLYRKGSVPHEMNLQDLPDQMASRLTDRWLSERTHSPPLAGLTGQGSIVASAAGSSLGLFSSQQAAAMCYFQQSFLSFNRSKCFRGKGSLWRKSTSRAHCVLGTVLDLRESRALVFLFGSQEFYSGTPEGLHQRSVCLVWTNWSPL